MNTPLPQFTDNIDLRYLIEPFSGPVNPRSYLDKFPDTLYSKATDSHFVRFMYTLLGPVGIAWLKAELLLARLELEAAGANLFQLERFYGDPFSFGRIVTESFDFDISGLLPAGVWDLIRTQDEAYRSRAIQFLNAARLGTTPEGMRLAATSGIGQNCDVIENYHYLFDAHSDDLLGIPHRGISINTGEFTVIPRPAVSRTQQETILFAESPVELGLNEYILTMNGHSTPPLNDLDPAATIQTSLQALPTIGVGNIKVSGGPAPSSVLLTFTGKLTNQSLPPVTCTIVDPIGGAILATVPTEIVTGGIDPSIETVVIADAERHHMQVAVDYLRPVASYPTFVPARSTVRSQLWSNALASSTSSRVVRFVAGNPSISWPASDNIHWIQSSTETEAPQLDSNPGQHYVGFHNVADIISYTDQAFTDPGYTASPAISDNYSSVHVGPFPEMRSVMPYFDQFTDPGLVFSPDRSLADYPEPLTVSAVNSLGQAFINGIYPADYINLQGVPQLKYHSDHFWSSLERPSGAEVLEIDLGSAQAVNYISLEVTRKPLSIAIDYDTLDQAPQRNFAPVGFDPLYPPDTALYFDPSSLNPWVPLEFSFGNSQGIIYTRFIRLVFTRRADTVGQFLFDPTTNIQTPWSIDVRNLRIGRNVVPSVL